MIFWLVLGSGFASTFQWGKSGVSYLEYFFPGVVVMVLLFASIFTAVSVIEDRQQGFLQGVLAGPASRSALVVGKCFGSATVALMQACSFLLLAPLAGYSFSSMNFGVIALTMLSASLGLTALGFFVAWVVDNVQAYHAIQMTLLMPLWMLSGAMFPAGEQPVMRAIMLVNPVSYAVSLMRVGLQGTATLSSVSIPLALIGMFALGSLLLATRACHSMRRF